MARTLFGKANYRQNAKSVQKSKKKRAVSLNVKKSKAIYRQNARSTIKSNKGGKGGEVVTPSINQKRNKKRIAGEHKKSTPANEPEAVLTGQQQKEQQEAEEKKKFLDMLADNEVLGNASLAAIRVGISPSKPYRWKKTDAEFAEEWKRIKTICDDIVADEAENSLLVLIRSRNPTAIIFTLMSRRPQRWKGRGQQQQGDIVPPSNKKDFKGTRLKEWLDTRQKQLLATNEKSESSKGDDAGNTNG